MYIDSEVFGWYLEGPVQGLVRLVPPPTHLHQRLGVEDGEVAPCNNNKDIVAHLYCF